jgi:hypothetical protein
MNGIAGIEFVPEFNDRQVVGQLQMALQQSERLSATVAYWCD